MSNRWFCAIIFIFCGCDAAPLLSILSPAAPPDLHVTYDVNTKTHPPLRLPPPAPPRPMAEGNALFVDAKNGDDENDGSLESPWRTVQYALDQLQAGATLYLRGGVHYTRAYLSVMGRPGAPVTIASYPGEQAVLDGSFPEFTTDPGTAWVPVAGGNDEYFSAELYRNLRGVHGCFADSMIGLQTYYLHEDLMGPRYCGPGLWYDPQTGRIHARLAPYTSAKKPVTYPYQAYAGTSNPCFAPIILASSHALPLLMDGAAHIVLRDLTIRGGGYDTVEIRHGHDITFENVTLWAGTYGLKASNTGPLRLLHCGFYGNLPPWSSRDETSLMEYPWQQKGRNLTRLNTHALLVPASVEEYSVYFYPYNHQWEIAGCEFADSHDGVYLGNVDGLDFHHNLVEHLQDDGAYLSSFREIVKPQHGPMLIHENVFRECMITLAFGGDARLASGVQVYRNLLGGKIGMGDHGNPPWEVLRVYHNTVTGSVQALFGKTREKQGADWKIINNLLVQPEDKPGKGTGIRRDADGNVHELREKALEGEGWRLSGNSSALKAGVALPADWPDPQRGQNQPAPDAGALPAGSGNLAVGRFGRYGF